MTTKVPVKSILKQQPQMPTPADEANAKTDRDRHNLDIALQHAYKIQDQKDWQTRIFKATEVLLDYPRTSPFSTSEANNFITLIQPFQPSDLDELVEERRIDGKCGYMLCHKAPRIVTAGKNAEWKFGKGAAKFCSTICVKKSAYVKAQLSSVPVWEREQGWHPDILLHEDDRPAAPSTASSRVVPEESAVANDGADLALERGEEATSFKPKQVMTDRIVEKATVTHKPLCSVYGAELSSTAIEGYEPRRKEIKIGVKDDDSDDAEDYDDGTSLAQQAVDEYD